MYSSWSHYWEASMLFMLQNLLGVFDILYLCNQTRRNAEGFFFLLFSIRLQPDVFVSQMKPMTVYSIISSPWMMNEIINAQTSRSRLSDGRINAAYCSWVKQLCKQRLPVRCLSQPRVLPVRTGGGGLGIGVAASGCQGGVSTWFISVMKACGVADYQSQ